MKVFEECRLKMSDVEGRSAERMMESGGTWHSCLLWNHLFQGAAPVAEHIAVGAISLPA